MKRYKLVRIVDGRFLSANTVCNPLTYTVGEITETRGIGIACYKKLKCVRVYKHISETMNAFNRGNPVAILEVESIGRHIPKADTRYRPGYCYEGGVNYPAVKVIRVVQRITEKELPLWPRE